jgi:hypothetical protein
MAEYDLQAEGTNGVTTTTGIDATSSWDPLTTTEFPGGVILHVDGRNAQSPINAIFGIGNDGGAGVFGLGGQGRPEQQGTGVIGVAGGVTNPDASVGKNCGVIGIGDGVGVFGQGDGVGVMGSSDSVGVEFGVGVGVLGVSERGRGGVFTTGTSPPVAQVQLVPVALQADFNIGVGQPPPLGTPPQLPQLGQAGDVLAVELGQTASLWFCVRSGTAVPFHPAIWAEIAFSRTIEGTGP